jgi:hypothetical protein
VQVAALEKVAEENGRLEARVAALQGLIDDSAAERRRAQHFREVRLHFYTRLLILSSARYAEFFGVLFQSFGAAASALCQYEIRASNQKALDHGNCHSLG